MQRNLTFRYRLVGEYDRQQLKKCTDTHDDTTY